MSESDRFDRQVRAWLDLGPTQISDVALDAARAEVGEEKYRVWRIYLAGSAHAFDRGWLSLWQILAGKPLPDGRLPHPLTRAYMYPAASG